MSPGGGSGDVRQGESSQLRSPSSQPRHWSAGSPSSQRRSWSAGSPSSQRRSWSAGSPSSQRRPTWASLEDREATHPPIPHQHAPLDYEGEELCHCGKRAARYTSWKKEPGRRIFVCATHIHNESSCSSPADGTPRSPADDTRTSPDEESPGSHSSTCHLDSGQQPHPRNMENETDFLDKRIMGMIGCISSSVNLSEGWYHGPQGIEHVWKKVVQEENFATVTKEMVKERIEKLERMVTDYHEERRSSLPNQNVMLHVFNDIGRQYYEIAHQSPPNYGKRASLVSEELEGPSTKRARSDSVDMVMYLSHPDAASKLKSSGFSMDDCTSRAERLFQDNQDDRRILYSALSLLRQNIEIRQSFMTLKESSARGYIEHELKDSGML